MSLTTDRNARLDALQKATEDWAAKRTAYLKAQVAFARRMLKGRTGSERLASTSVSLAKNLVVDAIGTFLTGK